MPDPRCPFCGLPTPHRRMSECIAELRSRLAAAEIRNEGLRRSVRVRLEQASRTTGWEPKTIAQMTRAALYNNPDRELELRISVEEGQYEALMVRRALEARGKNG